MRMILLVARLDIFLVSVRSSWIVFKSDKENIVGFIKTFINRAGRKILIFSGEL